VLQPDNTIAAFRVNRNPVIVATVTPSPSPRSGSELTSQLAVAALGAGVITSLAVAQGQSPLTALIITMFSAMAAVLVGQVISSHD